MHQGEPPLAAALGGDQRRAVGEPRPGLGAEVERRLGKDLARDQDVVRHLDPGEGRARLERGERRRPGPGHGAAQRAVAGAKLDRYQAVLLLGEAGSGEADHGAALVHPGLDGLERGLGHRVGVGEDEDRQGALEKLIDGALAHLAERRQGALEIVKLIQQGLGRVGRRRRHQPDGTPPPPFIEKHDGAGAVLAFEGEAREIVAKLRRYGEGDLPGGLPVREVDAFAHQHAAVIAGAAQPQTRFPRRLGAQHLEGELGALGLGRHQHPGERRRLIGDDVQIAEALQPLGQGPDRLVVQPVAQPHDVGGAFDPGRLDDLQHPGPVHRPRLGRHRPHQRAGIGGAQQLGGADRLARCRRRRSQHHHRAGEAFGLIEKLVHGADPRPPVVPARPTVVDDEDERPGAGQPGARIEQRMGKGENDEGGEHHAQYDQPQRRLGRRLLLLVQAEQQADGGKPHQQGRRRRHLEKPPQHRQDDERREHPGRGKSEEAKIQHRPLPVSRADYTATRASAP